MFKYKGIVSATRPQIRKPNTLQLVQEIANELVVICLKDI